MNARWQPKGIRFHDLKSGHDLLLVAEGEAFAGWLCAQHPDGHWQVIREADDDDRWAVEAAEKVSKVETVEGRIVERLFEDLRDRRFLKWVFKQPMVETIDPDIQYEIRNAWLAIIQDELEKERAGS